MQRINLKRDQKCQIWPELLWKNYFEKEIKKVKYESNISKNNLRLKILKYFRLTLQT